MNFNLNIYLDHFGLNRRPFTLVPDPDFMFWSRAHKKAKAILEYGLISRSPITLVTGEVGSGKTTLLRDLLQNIGDELLIGLISNATATDRSDLMRLILGALGEEIREEDSYATLNRRLEELLVEEYSKGRRVVLIFDEAQNLGQESLENLRMLTNINFADHELVQLVLVGQPELRDIIMRSDMTQLAQRISASVFLPRLTDVDVETYITHRLNIAGAQHQIFLPETFAKIRQATGGIPRLINQLCDFALLYAFELGVQTVDETAIQEVLDDNLFFCAGRGNPLRLVQAEQAPRLDSDEMK
ncbi:ATPase [Roseobacter sp. SK209-2-6]|uniref:ExeA family protein n=1 Tax=Roseobacter sp. SK209-2-6 TaxID=388739 RepID=UPI0000F3EB8C|nr:AAA family ATPase [Roseobacter sp. SK209-2-6]EBA14285.1 ATPase [Roseobacter sp. SK209-2-6]